VSDPTNLAHWIDWSATEALLDVGCNVGHLLQSVAARKPTMRLAGVEVNPDALNAARERLPDANLFVTGAEAFPFGDEEFR
jgi:trans-aconitate methyltransferase